MANLLDKNDRAIVAFLAPVVAAVNAGIQIYIRNDSRDRKVTDSNGNNVGLVDVDSSFGAESPKGSGNYDVTTMVRVKFPAAIQPNQSDEAANRVLLGKLQDAVVNALHQTDNCQDYLATAKLITVAGNGLTTAGNAQAQSDNADMADYSCLDVIHDNITGGKNTKDAQDLNFYELCNFKVYVAGYNGYWN